MNTNVYYFKRKSSTIYDWFNMQTLTQLNQLLGSTPSSFNIGFRLQDVPGYTDFTNMYDSYRLRAVKVNLIPVGNVSSSNTAGNATGPAGNYAVRCFSAFDPNYDGGAGVTGAGAVATIQEYQNCRWTPYNRIHKRYIKPKLQIDTGAGAASGYVNIAGKQPWIQCANAGIVHYGMPIVVDDSGFSAGSILYKVECTYYMQFARPK